MWSGSFGKNTEGFVLLVLNNHTYQDGKRFPSATNAAGDYICGVSELLQNPVYNALLTGDRPLSRGNENVRFFEEDVSPFAGFAEGYCQGFDELFEILRPDRHILFATPPPFQRPKGWRLLQMANGLQMLYTRSVTTTPATFHPVRLQDEHVEQMMHLTALTKPGPFNRNTLAFGSYYGIFQNEKLVAMTGQRLHVEDFTEISAVCTHPNHLGKGYAFALVQHQIELILQQGQTPFLHVREDNTRAVSLYRRMGFEVQRPMNFYFMKNDKGNTVS